MEGRHSLLCQSTAVQPTCLRAQIMIICPDTFLRGNYAQAQGIVLSRVTPHPVYHQVVLVTTHDQDEQHRAPPSRPSRSLPPRRGLWRGQAQPWFETTAKSSRDQRSEHFLRHVPKYTLGMNVCAIKPTFQRCLV